MLEQQRNVWEMKQHSQRAGESVILLCLTFHYADLHLGLQQHFDQRNMLLVNAIKLKCLCETFTYFNIHI